MSTFKKHKIVQLAANRARLFYDKNAKILVASTLEFLKSDVIQPYHLYVIDENAPINGDTDRVIFLKGVGGYALGQPNNLPPHIKRYKIIASTDPNIKTLHLSDNREVYFKPVPELSAAFLSRYCSKGGITPVMVEYDGDEVRVSNSNTITIKPVEETYTRAEVEKLCELAFDTSLSEDFTIEDWKEEHLK